MIVCIMKHITGSVGTSATWSHGTLKGLEQSTACQYQYDGTTCPYTQLVWLRRFSATALVLILTNLRCKILANLTATQLSIGNQYSKTIQSSL